MITDMTTSVPVINTARLERMNIHLISFSLFWTEVIKTKMKHLPKQNKNLYVCTKPCKNVHRVILTLIVTPDILCAVYNIRRKPVRIKESLIVKALNFLQLALQGSS